MKVAQLSNEARVSVGLEVKPLPSAHNLANREEWVLARARSMRAGLQLVVCEIDEIGISLKRGWITADRAAEDLAALERLPCYVASAMYPDKPQEGA
ncbi:hypothetical protein [Bradyrhizobium elkanii]